MFQNSKLWYLPLPLRVCLSSSSSFPPELPHPAPIFSPIFSLLLLLLFPFISLFLLTFASPLLLLLLLLLVSFSLISFCSLSSLSWFPISTPKLPQVTKNISFSSNFPCFLLSLFLPALSNPPSPSSPPFLPLPLISSPSFPPPQIQPLPPPAVFQRSQGSAG